MYTGVQFTGSLGPNASQRWFTYGWNAASHVVWYMMPTTVQPGAPEVEWSVGVERLVDTQVRGHPGAVGIPRIDFDRVDR